MGHSYMFWLHVIKKGDVMVPSEQQRTGFKNNCTSSLAVSWEAMGKNDARKQSGQADFFYAGSAL